MWVSARRGGLAGIISRDRGEVRRLGGESRRARKKMTFSLSSHSQALSKEHAYVFETMQLFCFFFKPIFLFHPGYFTQV